MIIKKINITARLRKHLLFLTLLFPLFFQGQIRNSDSIWKIINNTTLVDTIRLQALFNIAGSHVYNNPDTSLILAQQLLNLAQETKQKRFEGSAYIIMGVSHEFKGNYPKAIDFLMQALKKYEEVNFLTGMANCYNSLGNVYGEQSDYPNSLKYYLKYTKNRMSGGDKIGLAAGNNNLGIIYLEQSDYPKALDYFLQALKLQEELGDKRGIGKCYANIGKVYDQQSNYPMALEYYLKDLKLSEETNDKQKLGKGCIRVGTIYHNTSDLKKAATYYQRGLQLFKTIDYKHGLLFAYKSMGELNYDLGDYKKALRFYDSALQVSKVAGEIDGERKAYQKLATTYAKTGNYKEAYTLHVKFKNLTDSIFNVENSKQLSDMKTQFEVEKKEAELTLKSEAHEAIILVEKKRQQFIIYAGAVLLFLVVVFALFIFNRFKITQKQKKIIEQQKHLVDEKQKEILDSISYAKRLQEAILPAENYWNQQLPNSFVLYKPKDIVAGDFYWMEKHNELLFFAAADCTGHGVPGALVSVVCSNALNRTLLEFNVTEPGKILDKTRELVIATFEKSEKEVKDGMDISLCCLHTKTNELQWSGANNPLWYIRDSKILEIKPDKQPIGKYAEQKPFTTHTIQLKKGDTVCLFTDGYADQFGGPKGKKFKYKTLQENLLKVANESMEFQKQKLNADFESWKGDLEQVDDVCLIGVRI